MKRVMLRDDIETIKVEPTISNPDIKVEVGDGYVPKAILYPDSFSDDTIREKVERYQAQDGECGVCQRVAKLEKNKKYMKVALLVLTAIAIVIILWTV